jgi:two-component system CheB/CheR fusion protein
MTGSPRDHIWVINSTTDSAGRCTHIDEQWLAFTGQSRTDALGSGWFNAIHPGDRPKAIETLRATWDERSSLRTEFRVRRSDGAYRWTLMVGAPRYDAEGTFVGYVGSIVDIDDQRVIEDALKEADRRKDEFLAIQGHELRNPLAPIQNGVEILRRAQRADATAAERALVDMMQRQVGHLVRLVDDLLEISRIQSGTVELRTEHADVASIVREAVEISEPHIERKGHRVEMRVPAEPLTVLGDPVRLAQVLTNLINNATKYTAPSGLIEIDTKRRGGEAVIRVHDSGIGIAPEMLPHLFDLFSQVGGRRTDGGLGVGLALAKKLVDLHGGSLEAQSRGLGAGSEFVVTLPLAASPRTVMEAAELETRHPPPSRRLLVIDDNQDVADSLAMLMESFEAEVRVAYDGLSGVEAAIEFKPDIVFVDIRMPGMDGYETARRMRARLGNCAPRLIALTGLGQDKDRNQSRDAGFDLHLTKPVSAEALADLLRCEAARSPT